MNWGLSSRFWNLPVLTYTKYFTIWMCSSTGSGVQDDIGSKLERVRCGAR